MIKHMRDDDFNYELFDQVLLAWEAWQNRIGSRSSNEHKTSKLTETKK